MSYFNTEMHKIRFPHAGDLTALPYRCILEAYVFEGEGEERAGEGKEGRKGGKRNGQGKGKGR